MEELKYVVATKDDIEMLMDIRLEMLRVVNELPEDAPFSDELVRSSKEYFLNGNQTTVLALDGQKPVACASISYIEIMPTFDHPTGKRAHMMNVYTNGHYRRRGVSRELVNMLVNEAKEKGVTEISLDTTASGRPLYKELGFCASEECMVMSL